MSGFGAIGWGAHVAIGLALLFRPVEAPWGVMVGLALGAWPLGRGLVGARGTELRPAVVWGLLALGLGLVSQWGALTEPVSSGRPIAGHLVYLASLAVLAALISVLNARTPGGGAWAILMALLVLVFLIPWLEGGGASALGRLRLDQPWGLFYGLLVVAGVTNYLPTRFGPAALCLGAGLVLEYLALSGWVTGREGRARAWSAAAWLYSLAPFVASRLADRYEPGGERLDRLWQWFRDHWGVVWGLRVQERFNRTAEGQGWAVRLTWQGPRPSEGRPEEEDEVAESLLRGLLRRFARPSRLDEASDGRA